MPAVLGAFYISFINIYVINAKPDVDDPSGGKGDLEAAHEDRVPSVLVVRLDGEPSAARPRLKLEPDRKFNGYLEQYVSEDGDKLQLVDAFRLELLVRGVDPEFQIRPWKRKPEEGAAAEIRLNPLCQITDGSNGPEPSAELGFGKIVFPLLIRESIGEARKQSDGGDCAIQRYSFHM